MKCLPVLCLLLTMQMVCFGQRNCATNEYAAKMPRAALVINNTHSRVARDTAAHELIVIPVVVHVVYNSSNQNISDDQILSQIEVLNRDFNRNNADTFNTPQAFKSKAAGCGFKFCLARVDPQGRLTSGIERRQTSRLEFQADDAMKSRNSGGLDAWDASRYLNIWVCNLSSRSLGYATLPGGALAVDGVVINFDVFGNRGVLRAPFNKGRTATHEIGHWMGLSHIWGDQLCGDDGIEDTPPQKSYNFGCPSFPRVSNCSINGNGDMFMNFMDYADDACMNIFTIGQTRKMRGQFALNEFRNGFLDANVCDSSNATAPASTVTESGPLVTSPITISGDFSIQPNPARELTTIRGNANFDIKGRLFEIWNMYGQRVMQFTCMGSMQQVNLSALQPGVYVIRTGYGSSMKSTRLVKL